MMLRNRVTRRTAQLAARAGVLGSSVMLVITATGVLPGGSPQAGAAELAGVATIINPDTLADLASGAANTPFSLELPLGAACTGDSANGGYTVTSYMVKGDVDPATLTFNPDAGPVPLAVGNNFSQPLYEVGSGSPFAGIQTANADTPGGPGVLIGVTRFDFDSTAPVITPADIPAGTYNIGIACIKGPPSATQLDKFWTAQIEVAKNGDALTWTAVQQTGVTTTTGSGGSTSTTGSGGSTTSTTKAGGSTTSTTKAGGSTTSTTVAGGATTTTTRPSGTTGGGVSSSTGGGSSLAQTGTSPLGMAFWAAVLLICGRLAVVLGRPPRIPNRG